LTKGWRVAPGLALAGKHVAQQEEEQNARISDLEQQAPAQQAPAASSPMVDQLNQLAELHQQGVLTDEEFASAKAKLFSP
jgi:hypothetical protein